MIDELRRLTLTATVNEMKSPNQFIKKLIYGRHVTLPTEQIEIGLLTKAREMAPMVRKNGAAVLVKGHSSSFQYVEAPNIRIKRPFTPSELLFGRRPGSPIFSSGGAEQMSAVQAHINRDMQVMSDLITNREEWLCATSLTGVVAYQVAPNENFTITYPKPPANNITLTVFWDNADPTLPNVEEDFYAVKKILSDAVGLGLRNAIMGEEAAAAFRNLVKRQGNINQGPKLEIGNLTLAEQFNDDGALYLGRFCGVDCWEYSRTVADEFGNSAPLIRTKYVEFIASSPAAEFTLYYAAIPDMEAFQGGRWQGERFAKSWLKKDPSQQIALIHSRPLPVPRRPGAMVSMKVVSG